MTDLFNRSQDTILTPVQSLESDTGRVSVVRVARMEKPIEVGNKSIRPPVEDYDETDAIEARNLVAHGRRVNKTLSLDDSNRNEETSFIELSKLRSMSLIESGRVSVIKLPRNKTHGSHSTHPIDSNLHDHGQNPQNADLLSNQRSRTLNAGNVSVSRVRRSSISGLPTQRK